ncbi:MAG: hypothetical protein QGG58_01015 [Chloroflexota bacterium]|nr:hypothetical protein [Chloroflexota bacterium]
MSRPSLIVTALTLAIWLAIVLTPVSWPLTDPGRAPFRLGPISTDVRAGQTFLASEGFDQISLPLRVGGPFGSSNQVSVSVRSADPTMSWGARSNVVSVESTIEAMEQVTFDLELSISRPDPLYFEIEVAPAAEWPTYTLATQGDQVSGGRLHLGHEPGFADQDLVFQILVRRSAWSQIGIWWPDHRMMLVGGLILLLLVHFSGYTLVRAAAAAKTQLLRQVNPATASAFLVALFSGLVFLVAFYR